jgi:hypothetical protein
MLDSVSGVDEREDERYVVPRWPDGPFNLVAIEGGVALGPFTADSWEVGERGDVIDWHTDGAHPVRLRVRMQAGDLLYANNGDMGPMTYRISPVMGDGGATSATSVAFDLGDMLAALWPLLDRGSLTSSIADLEHQLDGRRASEIPTILDGFGIAPGVLEAALVARDRLGRINDIIHAIAIVVVLSTILEPEETMMRPSLAAGNDPGRPFDVQTDRRIAEFKLSRWDGHDTARKRALVKDLVHLAAEGSSRRAQLYVLDASPARFLRESRSTIAWAVDRLPATRALYLDRFGDLETTISDFYMERARHVEIVDIRAQLGQLLAADRGPLAG